MNFSSSLGTGGASSPTALCEDGGRDRGRECVMTADGVLVAGHHFLEAEECFNKKSG
jgi:hypothetical protein